MKGSGESLLNKGIWALKMVTLYGSVVARMENAIQFRVNALL